MPSAGGSTARPPLLHLPGSKYYTLRYLLVALLAAGESRVAGAALSNDTAVLVRALRALGAQAEWQPPEGPGESWDLCVGGVAGRLQTPPDGALQVGNAGAVLRLLLGLGALLPYVRFETDHPGSLGRRPNADLLVALESLGMMVEATWPDGLLPITLRGGPPRGGAVSISGARSSQYISALLYLAPLLPDGLRITVTDELRSAPLVWATIRALTTAGIIAVASPDLREISVPGGQTFRAGTYRMPGDAPSAAALISAALAADVPLVLSGLDTDDAGAAAVLSAYDRLGLPALAQLPSGRGTSPEGFPAIPSGVQLRGATIDGDAVIDSVPALVAAACFADGETRFERVATLRLKESNRIEDLCAELNLAGCDARPEPDALVVRGNPEGIRGGATVYGHDDHRLVQSLAIVALRSREGLTITGADAVAKSYPRFFDDLAVLGAEVTVIEA